MSVSQCMSVSCLLTGCRQVCDEASQCSQCQSATSTHQHSTAPAPTDHVCRLSSAVTFTNQQPARARPTISQLAATTITATTMETTTMEILKERIRDAFDNHEFAATLRLMEVTLYLSEAHDSTPSKLSRTSIERLLDDLNLHVCLKCRECFDSAHDLKDHVRQNKHSRHGLSRRIKRFVKKHATNDDEGLLDLEGRLSEDIEAYETWCELVVLRGLQFKWAGNRRRRRGHSETASAAASA
ncbi:hypothetical protein PTSG_07994 [Salpingoeca rosetta]|uniref:C2H2-type domain-containing protein n=1 Tax=Salpingoeca rosetta (strain ATCC 50818 / BSB-021) TaxID=946362 RepID=F2UGY2_SALR5|nr:uncharacterized protein PTSG_07994 [Salpingoeca rosetta]EGD75882.1 hypothetical protein PTSG_07994 [Salpingoeca rosetta]|eukprot:XP_004991803.1 hypothetical protein PTSG_07994 [Salpingoeca rosetta]